jgi:hypothetical protein
MVPTFAGHALSASIARVGLAGVEIISILEARMPKPYTALSAQSIGEIDAVKTSSSIADLGLELRSNLL